MLTALRQHEKNMQLRTDLELVLKDMHLLNVRKLTPNPRPKPHTNGRSKLQDASKRSLSLHDDGADAGIWILLRFRV